MRRIVQVLPIISSFSHGTMVTGLVAAVANNNQCIVGVSHHSTVIGGKFVFLISFKFMYAFMLQRKHIAVIYNHLKTLKINIFIFSVQESNY